MEQDYLIKKWLANELSTEEQDAFDQLKENELLKDIVAKAPAFSVSKFSTPQDFNALKERLDANKNASKTMNWYKPLLKIAGVLIIGVAVYFLVFSNNITTINTLAGEKKTVALPDLSEVVLNAVSTIAFNEESWAEKREVNLKGEAYFKVAKGATFDVITSSGKVTVVGTHFNVNNRQNFFEVSCFEGKVIVNFKGRKTALHPNEVYRVLNGIVSFDNINNRQEPFWIDNSSNFEKAPLQQVVEELERQFNVEIVAKNSDKNLLFTGGFSHNNLKDALESVVLPLNLKYVMESPTKISLYSSD